MKISPCFEDGNIVTGTLREMFFYSTFEPSKGVCKSLGMWKENEKCYIVMPLFPCTLEHIANHFTKILPFNDFLRLSYQISNGLRNMHEQGFLHRDIKPENILVNSSANLADFNLIRWASFQGENKSFPNDKLTENASTYICTLWTRAPELVHSILNGGRKGTYSTEIDIFSLGCTFLALASGDFVLGKQCSLDKYEGEIPHDSKRNTKEYRYLAGFLNKFGINQDIQAFYGKEYTSPRKWETAHLIVYEYVKHQMIWSLDATMSLCSLIAHMLHPLPSKRARLGQVLEWLDGYEESKEMFSETLKEFIARRRTKLITSKQSNLFFKISQQTNSLPPQQGFDSTQFWSLCANNFIPPFIACEVLRIKFSLPLSLQFSKTLLYLLDLMHEFQSKENYKLFSGIDVEHVFLLVSNVKPRLDTLSLVLNLSKTPFLVCCLAAELSTTGTCLSEEELKKSKTMYLSTVAPFFEAYGTSWKSQTTLRQLWSRL
jgi:serine/threonine protein kinase